MFVKRLFPLFFLRVLYVIVAKMPTILLWEVRDEGLSHYNYWEENCIYHYYMMHVTLKKSIVKSQNVSQYLRTDVITSLPIAQMKLKRPYWYCITASLYDWSDAILNAPKQVLAIASSYDARNDLGPWKNEGVVWTQYQILFFGPPSYPSIHIVGFFRLPNRAFLTRVLLRANRFKVR